MQLKCDGTDGDKHTFLFSGKFDSERAYQTGTKLLMAVKNIFFFYWFGFEEWSRISREVKQIKSTETTRLETNASRCCFYAIYVHMLILPPDNQRKLRPRANVLTNYTCQRFHFDFWIRFLNIWLRKRKPSAESNRDYHERDHDLSPVICQDFDFSCIQENPFNRLFFLCRICLIATMIRPFFFLIAVLWTRQFKYSHWIFL